LRIHVHLDVWEHESPSRARALLHGTLADRRAAAFGRIFRRLGLLYPPREVHLGYRALVGAAPRTRAQALEYLDSGLLPEDRRLLVPILEEPDRRAILASSLYGIVPYTRESSLADLLLEPDAWLQACALYVIGALRVAELGDRVRAVLETSAEIVRET